MRTRSASCKASAPEPIAYPVSSNSLLERVCSPSARHCRRAAVSSDAVASSRYPPLKGPVTV
jgi:hypothetical protein